LCRSPCECPGGGAVTLALEGAGSRKSLPALQAMASPRTRTGGDQLPVSLESIQTYKHMNTCTQYMYSHAHITCTLTMHNVISFFCIYICNHSPALTAWTSPSKQPTYTYTYMRISISIRDTRSRHGKVHRNSPQIRTLKYVYLYTQHVSIHTQSAFNYAIIKQNKNRRRRSGHCHRTHTTRPGPRTSSPH
jgi:hypothetical protein